MEIIRKKTTLKNLTFNVFLTQKIKNLGLLEDLSTDISTVEKTTTLNSDGSNKLSLVRSFDFNNPYKVGVNGVTEVTADSIKYQIDGVVYTTNLNTLDTKVEVVKVENVPDKVNFVRTENRLGLTDKIGFVDNVNIDRPAMSVIENFSKIQQISNPDELYGFSNNFYKVYDETL